MKQENENKAKTTTRVMRVACRVCVSGRREAAWGGGGERRPRRRLQKTELGNYRRTLLRPLSRTVRSQASHLSPVYHFFDYNIDWEQPNSQMFYCIPGTWYRLYQVCVVSDIQRVNICVRFRFLLFLFLSLLQFLVLILASVSCS